MPRVFDVASGKRIRVYGKLIRWIEHGREIKVTSNTFWEGTTTGRYFTHRGVRRRLIVNHTIECSFSTYGIWQMDKECELVEE